MATLPRPRLLSLGVAIVVLGCASEEDRWSDARAADTVEAYETFVARYPEGPHTGEARSRIVELDWEEAVSAASVDALTSFLEKHGSGARADDARREIERLELTALHRAVEQGDAAGVRALLDAGRDVDAVEGAGATPLHVAARACVPDVVTLLLEAGADPNVRGEDDSTPLHWAARDGCLPAIRGLVAAGAELDVEVRQPMSGVVIGEGTATYFGGSNPAVQGSALHWAAEYGQQEAATLLIDSGADFDLATGWGLTPLHMAARTGRDSMVRLLLGVGAQWHHPDLRNGQAIHYAMTPTVAEILIESGADLDGASTYRGRPIHNAAYLGHVEAVEFFLESGVDANRVGSWNMDAGWTGDVTPPWTAAHGGALEVLQMLELRGGDIEFRPAAGQSGGTLLHAASWEGHTDVVEYLIDRGLEVDALADMPTAFPLTPAWKGVTPLGIAAHFGHVEVMGALLSAGADIGAVSVDDWSILDLAMISRSTDAVAFLLENGVQHGMTPERIDRWNTSDEIKELLKSHPSGSPTP